MDGAILDSLESFDLTNVARNFERWDGVSSEEKKDADFRLPWPTFDMTSVKIPVSWLPKKCINQYEKRRQKWMMKKENA